MAAALAGVDTSTLVVFDIDNTLLEPLTMVGSDQWFDYFFDRVMKENHLTEDQTDAVVEKIWNQVQALITVHAVEPTTPALIKGLKDRQVKVMALTARTLDSQDRTIIQLGQVGITFAKSVTEVEHLILPAGGGVKTETLFHKGVLFANGNDKGKVLLAFLAQIGVKPARIVFIDDKKKNVDKVDRALTDAKIPNVEFRYGAADPHVKAFKGDVADIEYFYLQHVLTDDEAQALKAQGKEPRKKSWHNLDAWNRL